MGHQSCSSTFFTNPQLPRQVDARFSFLKATSWKKSFCLSVQRASASSKLVYYTRARVCRDVSQPRAGYLQHAQHAQHAQHMIGTAVQHPERLTGSKLPRSQVDFSQELAISDRLKVKSQFACVCMRACSFSEGSATPAYCPLEMAGHQLMNTAADCLFGAVAAVHNAALSLTACMSCIVWWYCQCSAVEASREHLGHMIDRPCIGSSSTRCPRCTVEEATQNRRRKFWVRRPAVESSHVGRASAPNSSTAWRPSNRPNLVYHGGTKELRQIWRK